MTEYKIMTDYKNTDYKKIHYKNTLQNKKTTKKTTKKYQRTPEQVATHKRKVWGVVKNTKCFILKKGGT